MEKLLPVEKLPVEVLEKVFEFLPYEDRKSVVLLNSLWRKAGEAPKLWTWVQLPTIEDQHSRAMVIEMLSFKRLARVEKIGIYPDAVSEDLLRAMVQHKGLKIIWMWRGELPEGLDSQLVVEVLTRMKSLNLGRLPTHFLIDLLTELSEGRSSLKELTLSNNNLGELPAPLVASALTRLVDVDLAYTELSTDHVAALMEAIDLGNSSIEKLSLQDSLPSKFKRTGPLNLKPLVKVEEVNLGRNFLDQQELVNFFAAFSPSTKLRKLRINIRLSDWPEVEVTAKAFNFLEVLSLRAYPYQVSRTLN